MDQKNGKQTRPLARKQDLITQELPNELLLYDLTNDKAHCLNETAAFVWRHCDGRTTPKEIARSLSQRSGATVDERLVWLAVGQLADNNLLSRRPQLPASFAGLNRREVVRAISLTAVVVAVPLITSIVAPTAAEAATCKGPGQACTSGLQCCSTVCNAGSCT